MTIGQGNFLGTLRDRYSDPLLTVLTALLLFLMFVVAPLQPRELSFSKRSVFLQHWR